ncbi:MAG: hypothetical protein HQL46_16740 [Gammaproteobacteria bacterium]|nr:hypothetical protein [Gammaproteobacteria bacterium]
MNHKSDNQIKHNDFSYGYKNIQEIEQDILVSNILLSLDELVIIWEQGQCLSLEDMNNHLEKMLLVAKGELDYQAFVKEVNQEGRHCLLQ